MNKKEEEIGRIVKKIAKYLVVGGLLLVVLCGLFYSVPAGHRGVLLTFGKPSMDVKEEGLHIKIPMVQKKELLEVRTQKLESTADSASKDLQDVQTTIALNYHARDYQVPMLYQQIGHNYRERIINPAIEESVKAITAKFVAEELITRRAEVREEIKKLLTKKLDKYYIEVDDFNIVNFQFSEEFDKAIEAKVTAEQLKLKAERDLERIKIEKEQAITQAQAQAEALRLQKQEVTEELVRLREIEMMMAAIEKWDGVMPQATSGMPFIDVSPKGGE